MPSSKAARSAERKRLRNRSVRSAMKTYITRAEKLIGTERSESVQPAVFMAISSIDKAVKKGITHRNKGARLKSRLMKRLSQVALEKSGG